MRDTLQAISDLGVIGLLILVLFGGMKSYWVWGWTYREIVRDRDQWRDIALRGSELADRSTALADRAVSSTKLGEREP